MAGVLKARDADGTVRTITAPKVRDVDGTSRALVFIRVRDFDGTVREAFTAGGGGGGGGGGANPTSITPGYRSYAGRSVFKSAMFTASSTGTAPTSFAWGFLDGDGGTVVSGETAATATLQVSAGPGETTTNTFFCDMVIAGTTYRATCQLSYVNISSGAGGELSPQIGTA